MKEPATEPRRNPAGPRSMSYESAAVNKASPLADSIVAVAFDGLRLKR